MPSYGIDFQPKTQIDSQQGGGGVSPLESVVKLLSLRLPTVTGARGLAPRGLLGGGGAMPGGGGLMGGSAVGGPDSNALLQWLQQLLQGGGSMTPTVIPGADDPMSSDVLTKPPQSPTIPPQDFPFPGGGLGEAPKPKPPQDMPFPQGEWPQDQSAGIAMGEPTGIRRKPPQPTRDGLLNRVLG